MTDYVKTLEDKLDELSQLLATTQTELAETKEKLEKWSKPYMTVLNDLVSVQPMTASTGMTYFLNYKNYCKKKRIGKRSLKKIAKNKTIRVV